MILSDFIVNEELTVLEVMKAIDDNTKGIAFVCRDNRLLGVVTDGDIRRFILRSGDLNSLIKEIANYNPKYVTDDEVIDYDAYMKKLKTQK